MIKENKKMRKKKRRISEELDLYIDRIFHLPRVAGTWKGFIKEDEKESKKESKNGKEKRSI